MPADLGLEVGESVDVLIASKEGGRIALALDEQPAAAKLEQVLADSCIIIGKLFLSKKLLDFSVMLSDLEFALLHCLWRHRGDTVSYEIILQEWGNSDGPLKPSGTLFTNFIPMVWRSKLIMALATVWRYLRAKLSLRPKTPE